MYLILRWCIPILFSLKRASNDKIVFFVPNLSSYPPVNCLLLCNRKSVKSTSQMDFANCRAGFSQKRTLQRSFVIFDFRVTSSHAVSHSVSIIDFWWLRTGEFVPRGISRLEVAHSVGSGKWIAWSDSNESALASWRRSNKCMENRQRTTAIRHLATLRVFHFAICFPAVNATSGGSFRSSVAPLSQFAW